MAHQNGATGWLCTACYPVLKGSKLSTRPTVKRIKAYPMLIASGLAALFLALIHFFANKLRFTHIPRSKWLSAAGGISVSYVFVHLLPELVEWQNIFNEKYAHELPFMEHHLYLVALLGLAFFYGMEKLAIVSKSSRRHEDQESERPNTRVFWSHIILFAFYNALIGYLLVNRNGEETNELLWFALAMGFHFIVNDYSLLDHYRKSYLHKGRWIVCLAVLGGWLLGTFTSISELVVALLFSLMAGGIILNVLKEELPEERKSNFWAFFSGIIFYSALLLFAA